MNITKELMSFIDNSPSVFHVIDNFKKTLTENGFTELKFKDNWKIENGKGYFVTNNDSSIIAFKGSSDFDNIRLIGSHSDSPTFRIKPNSIVNKDGFLTLNTEVYGGPILSTWFDRPLSVAGRVVLKSDNPFKPEIKHINVDKNLLIIPNVAIHMNRDVNNGYKFNAQKDTLPLLALSEKDSKISFEEILARNTGINAEDILDFDLFLYDRQKGEFVGENDEFYSVGRIDNLGMAFNSIKSLVDSNVTNTLALAMVFDNEEIGSSTKQGAGSTLLSDCFKKIVEDNDKNFYEVLHNSYLISADQAHSLHPNYTEMADPTNRPLINNGPVIKYAANGAYTSDAVSSSIFKKLCLDKNIPCQEFTNRSDKRGGSTIGPITVSNLDIQSIDIGNAILSMHSVRELGGCKDNEYIYELFKYYYEY